MSKYTRFTERNDWEGETWHFYIPNQSNGKAISTLKKMLEKYEDDLEDAYSVSDTEYSADTVDTLCENSDGGYMAYHNKLVGILSLRKLSDAGDGEEFFSTLYKGGLRDLME